MKRLLFCILLGLNVVFLNAQNFSEDFENTGDNLLKNAQLSHNAVSEISTGALSGNRSALLNTMGSKFDYPRSIRFFKDGLKNNSIYKVSFKYKVLELPKNVRGQNFVVVEAQGKGSNDRIYTGTFGSSVGEENVFSASFVACADDSQKIFLDLTSHKGSKIIIDDFKVECSPMNMKARWLMEKGTFKGMRYDFSYSNFVIQNAELYSISKDKFFPFVDKYGQFKHKNWEGKIKSDSDFAKRIEEENAFNKKNPKFTDRDEFGGFLGAKNYGESRHFRVKKVNGKWFFITPKGNLFWSLGIDCVMNGITTPISQRGFYFDDVSDNRFLHKGYWGKFDYEKPHTVYDFGARNITHKYGSDSAQIRANVAQKRFEHWGVNTLGAWSNSAIFDKIKTPYTVFIGTGVGKILETSSELYGYWSKPRDFFDPSFEKAVKKVVDANAKHLASPYCLGVFFDNELPWQTETLKLPKAVLTCPQTQYAKIAFADMLKSKYSDISKLNSAWKSDYKNWEDFLQKRDFIPSNKEGEVDLLAFEERFYEKYFDTCRNAIKAKDSEILYFGCRFAWVNSLLPKVASRYCDVVSFNLYRNSVSDYKMPEGAEDKPIIIGEYHFGSSDRGVIGGGLLPQQSLDDVVKCYTNYTVGAIENPNIIGAHWFQWSDQMITGRSDGENYAIGFVDVCDTPIYSMVKAARNVAKNMYKIRLSGKKTVKSIREKTVTY